MIEKIRKAIKDFIDSKIMKKKKDDLLTNLKKFPQLKKVKFRFPDIMGLHKDDTIFLRSMHKMKDLKTSIRRHIQKRIIKAKAKKFITVHIEEYLTSLAFAFSAAFVYELQHGFKEVRELAALFKGLHQINKEWKEVKKENKKNKEWANSYGDVSMKAKILSWFAKTFSRDQAQYMKGFNKMHSMFGGENPSIPNDQVIIDLDIGDYKEIS